MRDAETRIVLEIRTYRLTPGGPARFGELLDGEVGALLRDFGIRVVRHGPSLIDPQWYVLIRAFASLEEREELEGRFYGSTIWKEHYKDSLLSRVESYHDIVLDVPASVADDLADRAAI